MSRDPDKIDFSALDPSRNSARWEALVQQTLARRRVATVHPLFANLASSGRVALALAAALAVMAWLPSLFAGPTGSRSQPRNQAEQNAAVASATESNDPATRLALWASRGDIPSDVNMFDTFSGGEHGSE